MKKKTFKEFASQTITCLSFADKDTGVIPQKNIDDLVAFYNTLSFNQQADARDWIVYQMNGAISNGQLVAARAWLAMKEEVDPFNKEPDWKEAFMGLFRDIAACEAPEGTQVDNALATYQAIFNKGRLT